MNTVKMVNGFSMLRSEINCPRCGETLQPVDLEDFGCCPYCDFQFTKDAAFDDFVLSPLIRRWANGSNQNFPG